MKIESYKKLVLAGAVGIAIFACSIRNAAAVDVAPVTQTLTTQQRALHVLNRLAYGPAPGDLDRVMQMGVEAYIQEQLHPDKLEDPPALAAPLERLGSLKATPADLYASYGPPARRSAGQDQDAIDLLNSAQNRIADDAREARLLRAIYSPAQLRETMVDFWFNHFNVFVDKGQEEKIWVGAYERDAIRPYVLGRFRDLLFATARHPAMLYYLDNWQSSVAKRDKNGDAHGGLNENYAREVMELHTLGVEGGYSQKDVTELARILTGWTFHPKDLENRVEPAFKFDPGRHDPGQKTFLGRTFPAGGGANEGERALELLAASPETAKHIAYQLAQYFVADRPSSKLVDALARRFAETKGDIREVLATLFSRPEFWDPANVGNKFKTPYQYLVSGVRAAGLPFIVNVKPLLGMLYQNGEPLYGCMTPDGYKNTEGAWLNPDSMIYRLNFANALGNGYLPLWQLPQPPAEESQQANHGAGSSMETGMAAVPSVAAQALSSAPNRPPPPDPFALQATLGNAFSLNTAEALAAARPQLRAGLMLGSPEFMWH